MNFNNLDFHPQTTRRVSNAVERAYRMRTNHIVDSFSLRVPKKIKTNLFHKLNVCACEESDAGKTFWEMEGIANVELRVPDIASIYRASQAQAVKRMTRLLGRGIEVAARHDSLFARHRRLWKRLLATAGDEFDHELGISRSHRSRRWRCDVVLRLTPARYYYDLLVKDSKSQKTIERHTVKSTECMFPFYEGIGFSKLRWDKQDVVGLTKGGDEAFRVETKIPA